MDNEIIIDKGCGLDVHKETVVACVMGSGIKKEIRIQKVLEDANVKISSVLSDTFGASGSQMIEAIMEGKLNEAEIADLAKGKLKSKKEEIREALVGYFQDHHRFMIKASLEHIKYLEKLISDLDQETKKKLARYQKEYELLQTIPGVKEQGATAIIAEIGADMDVFPSEGHLSSWAGMSPGNNESAGKKKVERQPTAIRI
jgi:hypothetical protein